MRLFATVFVKVLYIIILEVDYIGVVNQKYWQQMELLLIYLDALYHHIIMMHL
jgi:hypothetical protein